MQATFSRLHVSYFLESLVFRRDLRFYESRLQMFLILALVLVILWIGGFTVMHVSGFFIHLLLIFAVISIIMHFIGGRKSV
jgi:hypothetical protein